MAVFIVYVQQPHLTSRTVVDGLVLRDQGYGTVESIHVEEARGGTKSIAGPVVQTLRVFTHPGSRWLDGEHFKTIKPYNHSFFLNPLMHYFPQRPSFN